MNARAKQRLSYHGFWLIWSCVDSVSPRVISAVRQLHAYRNQQPKGEIMFDVSDIHMAALEGDVVSLQRLIADGGNIHETDVMGGTPLYYAAKNGHLKAVMLLLQHGAHVDATTSKGYTPLMVAAADNFHDVVKVLLDNGANADLREVKGYTAREIAAARDHTETVQILEAAVIANNKTKRHL